MVFCVLSGSLLPNVLPEYRLYNAVFILLNLSQRSFFNSKGVGCAVLVVGGRPSAPRDPWGLQVHLSFIPLSWPWTCRGRLAQWQPHGSRSSVPSCRWCIAVSYFSTCSDGPVLSLVQLDHWSVITDTAGVLSTISVTFLFSYFCFPPFSCLLRF